jgi:branched-chain amino acid transport system permease protein
MSAPGKRSRVDYIAILAVCFLTLVLSWLVGPDRYVQRLILLVVLWASMSSGFNLISGYGGQVVFGYMVFVGTGSYTTVLLFKAFKLSPWIGMWVGAVLAILIAFIIGLPTLRLRGHYFAVATIAFPLMAFPVLNHLGFEEVTIPFTGEGLSSFQFRDLRYYVLIAVVLLGIVLVLIKKIEGARLGFALNALKQNETAAEGMGIDTFRAKMIAFMVSAAIGAIGGVIYAFSLLYVLTTHAVFGLFIIVRILSITIVGGFGTLWGPVIAAAILVPVGEFLTAQFGARAPGIQDVVYGIALVLCMLYLPDGIWGRMLKALHKHGPADENQSIPAPALAGTPGDPASAVVAALRAEATASLSLRHASPEVVNNKENDPLLRIKNVSKYFGGVKAIDGLSVNVPFGKLVGIIGPNGAGKTTLFNVINGYMEPEKGKLLFDDVDTTSMKPNRLCKLGVGRTFQVPQIFRHMSVVENIMVGAFAKTRDADEAFAIAENVARQMGLSKRSTHLAAGLTMWEIKMVEISRALATKPQLLLLDEPMSGLNLEETDRIGAIIRAIADRGITIIVIEHVVQSLVKIADVMVALDHGQKVAEGTPQEVIEHPEVIEAYLGAKWRKRYAGR